MAGTRLLAIDQRKLPFVIKGTMPRSEGKVMERDAL